MEFKDTYNTIASSSTGVYKEKGSKFISFAFNVEHEEQVKEHVQKIKKEYYDARHHCYAYVLGFDRSIYRENDDGEPSGTAGKPIHGQIDSFDITNTLIIVVRYFGGIKLGVSGLIKAYKAAAKDALQNVEIKTYTINDYFEIAFKYEVLNDVMRIIKDELEIKIINTDLKIDCKILFMVRKKYAKKICDRLMSIYQVSLIYKKTL